MIKFHRDESWFDRIVSVTSYLTRGFVGFIVFIILTLMKKPTSPFLRYHVFQSIFLSIILFLTFYLGDILLSFAMMVPVVGNIVMMILTPLNMPIVLGLSALEILINGTFLYLGIAALFNKYSYLPWVSDIVRSGAGV